MTSKAPIDPGPVVRSTVASLILPGLGQLLAGARLAGGLMLGAALLGAGAVVAHLVHGLGVFESPLGAFLFRVLLRGLAVLHAFAVIDAYGRTAAPDDASARQKRLAVGWNLLVPGAGYLVSRAYLRAATGLAILVLLLVFARAGRMAFLDVIFVGMQLTMAGLAYLQLRTAEERAAQAKGELLPPPRPAVAPAAQVVCLVAALGATILCGWVVLRSIPESSLRGLTREDIQVKSGTPGVELAIPRLGLSLRAEGPGWSLTTGSTDFLFRAEHLRGGQLMLGVQQVYPFERPERMQRRLRSWLEAKGLAHQRTLPITLNGATATQMRFTGDFSDGNRIDHWAITVPQRGFAFLLMLQCERSRCSEVAPILERSRDTFRLAQRGPVD